MRELADVLKCRNYVRLKICMQGSLGFLDSRDDAASVLFSVLVSSLKTLLSCGAEKALEH